jgi:Transposase
MSHATFLPPDLGSFCRLDELGLQVVGQRLEPGCSVLACRVVQTDEFGRTLKQRATDILAFFDRPGTSNSPTEAINGGLEHLRGSALGFRNLTGARPRAQSATSAGAGQGLEPARTALPIRTMCGT